jgi:cytosine/adenosine deaminase-related metal-dependent hydrolase
MLSEAFGSNEAALAAATQVNGRHVDRGGIGRIAVGNFADLLILQRDPRSDLAAVKDWSFLMTGGRMYERGQIEAAVKRYDQHFRGSYYETLMNGLVGVLASSFSREESH